MKRCSKCGLDLPLDRFYREPKGRDGRRGDCIDCVKAYRQARYPEVREATIARVKAWQDANRDRVNADHREPRTRPEVKAQERAGHLKRKFGITLETYDDLFTRQGGVCAICQRPPRDDISLHVDHEHETGRVRGLLCFRCNNALGDFDDDPVRLFQALAYLGFEPEDDEPPPRRRLRTVVVAVPSR